MEPRVVIVSGPSGAGKGTVIARARQEAPIALAVSATTRPPRPGDVPGETYHFLSRERFTHLIATGQVLEHVSYAGNLYGTLASELATRLQAGQSVLVECEIEGARAIRRLHPCVSVFIAPPSLECLERRLRLRGTEDEPAIQRRLSAARTEIGAQREYDRVIVNDNLEGAVAELAAVFETVSVRDDLQMTG